MYVFLSLGIDAHMYTCHMDVHRCILHVLMHTYMYMYLPTDSLCLLTSNSYCRLDCICLTQIRSWVIIGWARPPLLKYWGGGGHRPPLPPPPSVPTPMLPDSIHYCWYAIHTFLVQSNPPCNLMCPLRALLFLKERPHSGHSTDWTGL